MAEQLNELIGSDYPQKFSQNHLLRITNFELRMTNFGFPASLDKITQYCMMFQFVIRNSIMLFPADRMIFQAVRRNESNSTQY
jgi:hypothetical protein